jgi:hypothetical protein
VISSHSANEVIFAQGDDTDAVFYIRRGKVKVAIVSEGRRPNRVGPTGEKLKNEARTGFSWKCLGRF